MQIVPVFEKNFLKVYGKPCWRVSPGWGSFLTLEFGTPHLVIREPIVPPANAPPKVEQNLKKRRVFINGDYHLWIKSCNWKVRCKRKLVGESTLPESIQSAADALDGQKLTRFSISPRQMRCVFEFDLGGVLETRPYDPQKEQWLFYDSRVHKVLILRADGCYSYQRSDRPAAEKWKPIQISDPDIM
jgi:hypothetical protein